MILLAAVAGTAAGFFLRALLVRPVKTSGAEERSETVERGDDRFDALVRALPLGVLMLDGQVRVRFANRAAASIFGFELSRVFGVHLIEAMPSIELERRAEAALEGEASMAPMIVPGRSGSRTYAVSAYPLTDDAGLTIGALILAEDQTELLALERARQEFLTNVSHELRTPLSSIRLMLETVDGSHGDEARDLFIPQALAQVDRLTSLVQSLLQQARAESGALRLDLREVDLEAVARPIVGSFEPQAAAKNVRLELHPLRPVRLQADPERLAQVLVNLIDNALRFTPEGGLVTTEIDADGAEAILRVSDTGIGIPYRDLPYIFERFYVVDRSRAREVSGVGLGLSIVKHIVEAHGGSVSAESTLGSGTKFTARFPFAGLGTEPWR